MLLIRSNAVAESNPLVELSQHYIGANDTYFSIFSVRCTVHSHDDFRHMIHVFFSKYRQVYFEAFLVSQKFQNITKLNEGNVLHLNEISLSGYFLWLQAIIRNNRIGIDLKTICLTALSSKLLNIQHQVSLIR